MARTAKRSDLEVAHVSTGHVSRCVEHDIGKHQVRIVVIDVGQEAGMAEFVCDGLYPAQVGFDHNVIMCCGKTAPDG